MKISNFKFLISKNESGQALITLLFFMVIGITVITATVLVLFINNLSASTSQQGTVAYYLAESGAEDGYLRVLRNPTYVTPTPPAATPAPLIVGSGTVSTTISNSGSTPPITITILSTGAISNVVRKIQVQVVYNSNGTISVTTWKEIN